MIFMGMKKEIHAVCIVTVSVDMALCGMMM